MLQLPGAQPLTPHGGKMIHFKAEIFQIGYLTTYEAKNAYSASGG